MSNRVINFEVTLTIHHKDQMLYIVNYLADNEYTFSVECVLFEKTDGYLITVSSCYGENLASLGRIMYETCEDIVEYTEKRNKDRENYINEVNEDE